MNIKADLNGLLSEAVGQKLNDRVMVKFRYDPQLS